MATPPSRLPERHNGCSSATRSDPPSSSTLIPSSSSIRQSRCTCADDGCQGLPRSPPTSRRRRSKKPSGNNQEAKQRSTATAAATTNRTPWHLQQTKEKTQEEVNRAISIHPGGDSVPASHNVASVAYLQEASQYVTVPGACAISGGRSDSFRQDDDTAHPGAHAVSGRTEAFWTQGFCEPPAPQVSEPPEDNVDAECIRNRVASETTGAARTVTALELDHRIRRILAETTVQSVGAVEEVPGSSSGSPVGAMSLQDVGGGEAGTATDTQEEEKTFDSRPQRRKFLVVLVVLVLIAVGVTAPLVASKGGTAFSKAENAPVAPVWKQIGQDLDGPADVSFLGASVSLNDNGTILATGAPGYGENAPDAGQVRVFQYNADTVSWKRLGQDMNGAVPYDYLGWSVCLNGAGDTVAIGADQLGNGAGTVQVYHYDDATWSWIQMGQSLNGDATGDQFGYSVALSEVSLSGGQRVAACGPFNDDNGSDAGHVRVFEYDVTQRNWNQIGQDIIGGAAGERFGFSVSLDSTGSHVAIGSNTSDTSDGGTVRVYEYDDSESVWMQIGQDIQGEAAGDAFGFDVSVSGDGLVVAASGALGSNGEKPKSGYVRVHQYNATTATWTQMGQVVYGEDALDEFGYSVSLNKNGTQFAAGAPNNYGGGPAAGHTRVFQYDMANSRWVQVGQDVDGEDATDSAGFAVSLAGNANVLAVGAYANDGSANLDDVGHVRVFLLTGS